MLQFDQKQVIGIYLHVVDAEDRTFAPRLDLAPTSTALATTNSLAEAVALVHTISAVTTFAACIASCPRVMGWAPFQRLNCAPVQVMVSSPGSVLMFCQEPGWVSARPGSTLGNHAHHLYNNAQLAIGKGHIVPERRCVGRREHAVGRQ